MSSLKVAVSIVVLVAWCTSFAQSVDQYDLTVSTEILVKFRASSLSAELAAIPLAMGAGLDSSNTGIRDVDDVICRFGVPTITRPFPFELSGGVGALEQWFQLRFDSPVDVHALKLRLEALKEVVAVALVYRGERQDAPYTKPDTVR